MALRAGIDIGGTNIAGGVVDTDGQILERVRVDTPKGHGSSHAPPTPPGW